MRFSAKTVKKDVNELEFSELTVVQIGTFCWEEIAGFFDCDAIPNGKCVTT